MQQRPRPSAFRPCGLTRPRPDEDLATRPFTRPDHGLTARPFTTTARP
ncbi:hypothetical protein [Streptomyces sp. AC558_RSS880]|nr:hypothetical protein [Streptomyces sp. AC558_RSS880]